MSRNSNFPIKENNSALSDPPGPSNIGVVVAVVVVGASVLVRAHSRFVASQELLNSNNLMRFRMFPIAVISSVTYIDTGAIITGLGY